MSRLGMFVCLLMVVAVAVCVDMPPNMKALDSPKDGTKIDASRHEPQVPPRPEGIPPRPEGKPDLPKAENPKPDGKPPQNAKS